MLRNRQSILLVFIADREKRLLGGSFCVIPQEWLVSNFSLQYHPWIKRQSHENIGDDHQLELLLIVKQILLVSLLGNV